MLTFSAAEIDWAVGKLSAFAHMHGFPNNQFSIEQNAAALLRIAHPGLVAAKLGVIAVPEQMLDSIEITHQSLGPVKPVGWLIAECLDRYQFFPAPPVMRAIFCQYFPAADGKEPESDAPPRKEAENG